MATTTTRTTGATSETRIGCALARIWDFMQQALAARPSALNGSDSCGTEAASEGAPPAGKFQARRAAPSTAGHASVLFCRISELNDRQTTNAPEAARIDRHHGVAERERGRTDKEIGEWNHDSAALLRRIQLAREPCNVRGQRIDRDGGKQLLDEGFAARLGFGGISTVDSVYEFNDSDGR